MNEERLWTVLIGILLVTLFIALLCSWGVIDDECRLCLIVEGTAEQRFDPSRRIPR